MAAIRVEWKNATLGGLECEVVTRGPDGFATSARWLSGRINRVIWCSARQCYLWA